MMAKTVERTGRMSEERKRILQMLAEDKIDVDEAERLLEAIDSSASVRDIVAQDGRTKSGWKFLRVIVEPTDQDGDGKRVNIRVPVSLLRAGIKLSSLIPNEARSKVTDALRDKGVDIDLKTEDLTELIDGLGGLTVNVDKGDKKVRIFCE